VSGAGASKLCADTANKVNVPMPHAGAARTTFFTAFAPAR